MRGERKNIYIYIYNFLIKSAEVEWGEKNQHTTQKESTKSVQSKQNICTTVLKYYVGIDNDIFDIVSHLLLLLLMKHRYPHSDNIQL